jgi:hypothetical protein
VFAVEPWKNRKVVTPDGGETLNETARDKPAELKVAVAVDAPVVLNARNNPVIIVCPV